MINTTAIRNAMGREISPVGIGLAKVRRIRASGRYSWTWFNTEVPPANKKTPLKSRHKVPGTKLPVKKYPVMAETETINERGILVNLTKIEMGRIKLFLLTRFFEIINNIIKILVLENSFVGLHQPFVKPFDNFNIWI